MKKIILAAVIALIFSFPATAAAEGDQAAQQADLDETEVPPADENEAAMEDAETAADASTSSKVTLDFKDADINNVLRILSLKSGVNIVAGPEVQGTVTIRLTDVPWEKALEVVLRTYGYVYEREGNIIRVTSREKVEQEDLITETFVLNYSTAAEVSDAIKEMLSERGKIKAVTRTNTVIVTDVASNVFKISQVVKRLDKPTPQAYIDSKVVRTELGNTENLGIEWNIAGTLTGSARPTSFPFRTPGGGDIDSVRDLIKQYYPPISPPVITGAASSAAPNAVDLRQFPLPSALPENAAFTFGRLNWSQFSSILNLIRTRTNTKIVSNPRIVVLNNQTAKVQVGDQVPIPTFERNETTGSFEVTGFNFKDVGVVLNVTPHINAADEILVDLKPEVSSEGALLAFSNNLSAPRFTVTQAQTQVLIKDGETIAIGGLLTDSFSATERKVPLLGDIPGVGKVFRSKRQTAGTGNNKVETLFFVTVSIVDTEGQPVNNLTPIV